MYSGESLKSELCLIHEVHQSRQLRVANPLEIEQRVLVRVSPQHCFEEGGAGREQQLVSGNLAIFTTKGHVEKVLVRANLFKRSTDIFLKVIPTKTELFFG